MKTEIVILPAKNRESYIETRRDYQGIYKCREFLTFKSIRNWVDNFLMTGNVGKLLIKRGLAKVDEVEGEVATNLKSEPKISIRRLSAMTGSSIFTMWRALKTIKFHPYRMLTIQKLETCNYKKRHKFCMEELENIEEDSNYLINLIFSDEAHFHLDG